MRKVIDKWNVFRISALILGAIGALLFAVCIINHWVFDPGVAISSFLLMALIVHYHVNAGAFNRLASTLGNSSLLSNNLIVPGFDDEKDENLRIRLRKIEEMSGCLLLYLSGYIDTYNSNYFQKRVAKAIEAGYIRLIFHISETNFVSSTEIGCYTAFLKAIRPCGGDLVLLEMQPKVYEVYQLLGFSQFFHIKEDLDEAVSFFTRHGRDENGASFPRIFRCPICSSKLRASNPGSFRCVECKTVLAIDSAGQVFLG